MPAGTLTLISGSQTVTGTFATVKALVESDVTISGSNVGNLRFILGTGQEYTNFVTDVTLAGYFPANEIESITVNNSYGNVVAVQVPTI